MSRIVYGNGSPFGGRIAILVANMRSAQANLMRCKQVADALTAGGTNTAALEGSAEFAVGTGQGAAFYAALQSLDAALFTTPSTWTPVQASVDLDLGGG